VEWLKVKALNSNPSTTHKKKKKKKERRKEKSRRANPKRALSQSI
jgi:hypothetical protein